MPDRAVHERADERGASEDAEHEPEVGGAAVLLLGEDGHHDRERRFEEVGEEHHERRRLAGAAGLQMNRMPSASSAKKLPLLLASGDARRVAARSRPTSAAETRKLAAFEPQRRRRAERRDEHAADRRADEERALLDRRPDPARALHPRAGELDEVGEERGARGRAGCVEERAEEDQRHQLPELDPDRRVRSGIAATAPALARSATMLVVRKPSRSTTTPPKNAGEHDRQEVEEHGEAR